MGQETEGWPRDELSRRGEDLAKKSRSGHSREKKAS